MNGTIEALHIYDDNQHPILSHTYTGRPLPASILLSLYLEHAAPRPNLIYLPNASPPTLVFSLMHGHLLFLATSSAEIEPLLVLEFLHRVIDAFEDFFGAPLLALKIESNYDVVAQLLTEMCDGGFISTTEPNALRENVVVEGWMGKLLGSISLPGKLPSSASSFKSGGPALIQPSLPALPWRRANVRHMSSELYADIVETLSVTLAPSGRPLAAFAHGSIAFTAKVSGVPDILVTLTSPAGKHNLGSIVALPVFHPCVRLNRWKERPGELSFVPPDGRFVLAGYEVDLCPMSVGAGDLFNAGSLKLPVSIEVKTGLGPAASEFEVRLQVNRLLGDAGAPSAGMGAVRSGSGGSSGRIGGPHPGSPAMPSLEDVVVTVPLPEDVRNLSDIRPSRGDASLNAARKVLEWHVPSKDLSGATSHFSLRCKVVGTVGDCEELDLDAAGLAGGGDYGYDEPYQSVPTARAEQGQGGEQGQSGKVEGKKVAQNKMLMPSSAAVSFAARGWLASGLKVESILLDTRKSRGLGEGVKPYKGVKYLTVSKSGVEMRC